MCINTTRNKHLFSSYVIQQILIEHMQLPQVLSANEGIRDKFSSSPRLKKHDGKAFRLFAFAIGGFIIYPPFITLFFDVRGR
mmetsp:Transcript_34538/g.39965  ORF Transcript_34538/g.39965 Transcript_34538/m.39965 type:complete len:82 (-) Transcript_34538:312-557(-)